VRQKALDGKYEIDIFQAKIDAVIARVWGEG